MIKKLLLTSIGVLLALTFLFLPANQVLADKPDKFTLPVDDSFPVDGSEAQCGFAITETQSGEITLIGLYDNEGEFRGYNAIFGQRKVTWSANGKVANLKASGPFTYKIKPSGDIWMVSLGTAHVLTLPGHGIVAGYAGQDLVLINAETGEESYKRAGHFDITNWEAICSYFE